MPGTLNILNMPILGDRYFQRLRDSLVDSAIYERGGSSVPFTTTPVSIEGTLDTPSGAESVEIYLNDSLQSTVTADATSGIFRIGVTLIKGENKVHAIRVSDGTIVGSSIFLNTYTYNTIFQAYGEEYTRQRDLIEAALQEHYLDDGTDLDGNPIQTSDDGLKRNFGQYVSGARIPGQDRIAYQAFLLDQFDAYQYSTTIRALEEIAVAYLGTLPSFTFYKDTLFARGYDGVGDGLDYGFDPSVNPFVDPLALVYNDTEIWMYRHWFKIKAGALNLVAAGAESTYWVYVDGDVDINSDLTVKTKQVVIPTEDYPLREQIARTQTIDESELLEDTDGSITGVAGSLYFMADRIALSLDAISGSVAGDLSGSAAVVPGTGWVDLGVQTIAASVGDVTVTYQFKTEPRILCKVTVSTTAVIRIERNSTIRRSSIADGTSGGFWAIENTSRANEFIIVFPNVTLLAADPRADFDTLCAEVIPAHKLKILGDAIFVGSPQFPTIMSAELGATTRELIDSLDPLSAELGASSRFPPVPVSATGAFGLIFPEFGGTSRGTPYDQALTCVEDFGPTVRIDPALTGPDYVVASIRPSDGAKVALIQDRDLYIDTGSGWGAADALTTATIAVAGSSNFAFHQNSDMMFIFYESGVGLTGFYRPVGGGGDDEQLIEADGSPNNPDSYGRFGVCRRGGANFAVAYWALPGAERNLYYKVYDVATNTWSAFTDLGNPENGGTVEDILVRERPIDGKLNFFGIMKGPLAGDNLWAHFRTEDEDWEQVYNTGSNSQSVAQIDFAVDPTDPIKAYGVVRHDIVASATVDAKIMFVERTAVDTWVSEQISFAFNRGANWPSIEVDENGNIFIVWTELDTLTTTKAVFMKCRKAGESSFGPTFKVDDSITATTAGDTHPSNCYLARRARERPYSTVCTFWGDQYGSFGQDSIYQKCGIRAI